MSMSMSMSMPMPVSMSVSMTTPSSPTKHEKASSRESGGLVYVTSTLWQIPHHALTVTHTSLSQSIHPSSPSPNRSIDRPILLTRSV